ncbi:hypothetical protein NONO_c48040 [Nocardia nova SH22a]|uniref:Uncharacterized protein n=1 Tax=Nocardia nova SH22a TaxID=1415166 RepID=W5TKT9_9NOCA|nr:hypothetical protein NONO_c48040 [Nocardia nova SH22a]
MISILMDIVRVTLATGSAAVTGSANTGSTALWG